MHYLITNSTEILATIAVIDVTAIAYLAYVLFLDERDFVPFKRSDG